MAKKEPTPEEIQEAIDKRDAALERERQATEESQRIEKSNEDARKRGVDLENANKRVENDNKALLRDREGAAEELQTIQEELSEVKSELADAKRQLEQARLNRDEENAAWEQERKAHADVRDSLERQYSADAAAFDDDINNKRADKSRLTGEVAFLKSTKADLTSQNDGLLESIAQNKDTIAVQEGNIKHLAIEVKDSEEAAARARAEAEEAGKVADEASTRAADSIMKAKMAHDEMESRKTEVFALSDRRKILDERERILKARYAEAGLTYPEA